MVRLSSDDTLPSTPARAASATFSDEPSRTSSPPSSPPCFPWEQRPTEPKAQSPPQRMTAFSVLGKRKALAAISDNARPAKRSITSKPSSAKAAGSGRSLTQMQLSIGQKVQTRCRDCGMEYVLSAAEDRKLHNKFHQQHTEGYDVGRVFIRDTPKDKLYKGVQRADDFVVAVDCFDAAKRRRDAQQVLDIVQDELGAVAIPADRIWTKDCVEGLAQTQPDYRTLLYIRGTKCLGFLLTQRIAKAYPVEPQEQEDGDKEQQHGPLELSRRPVRSSLGICRIWTHRAHRHENIATTLLDRAVDRQNLLRVDMYRHYQSAAAEHPLQPGQTREQVFRGLASTQAILPRIDPPRKHLLVAFSQPTEAGTALARKWFGMRDGWSVYMD